MQGSSPLTFMPKQQHYTITNVKKHKKTQLEKRKNGIHLSTASKIKYKQRNLNDTVQQSIHRLDLFNKKYFGTQTQALGPHNSQSTHLNRLNNHMLGQEERLSASWLSTSALSTSSHLINQSGHPQSLVLIRHS